MWCLKGLITVMVFFFDCTGLRFKGWREQRGERDIVGLIKNRSGAPRAHVQSISEQHSPDRPMGNMRNIERQHNGGKL